MAESIHGVRISTDETRQSTARLRDAGFRVRVGDGKVQTDVTDRCANLRYSSRLPGGYADCSFTLDMALRDTLQFLYTLAYVRVDFRGQLAWEGRVEELPRGFTGDAGLPVTALGKGAVLRSQKVPAVFVDSGYSGWVTGEVLGTDAPLPPTFQENLGGLLTGQGTIGVWHVLPNGQTSVTNESIWSYFAAPPGTLIRRIDVTRIGNGSPGGNVISSLHCASDPDLASYEDVYSGVTWSGSTNYSRTLTTPRRYLRLDSLVVTGYLAGAGTGEGDSFGLTNLLYTTELDADGGVLDVTGVTPFNVIRSILANYTGGVLQSSPEAMYDGLLLPNFVPGAGLDAQYLLTSLSFPAPTTPEDMITEVNKLVGWEWGVFENGLMYYGPMHLITTVPPSGTFGGLGVYGYPPWWIDCRAGDGHDVNLTASLTDTFNAVQVAYKDESGIQQLLLVTDYTNGANPLNNRDGSLPPRETRTGTVTIPDGSSAADAAAAGDAFLADASRAQVKGDVTWNTFLVPKVEVGASGRGNLDTGAFSPEYVLTPLIRPGWWVQVPDALQNDRVGRPAQLDRFGADNPWEIYGPGGTNLTYRPVPDDLLPVRSVEVDADAGTVRCSLDSTRDLFDVQLARLQQRSG